MASIRFFSRQFPLAAGSCSSISVLRRVASCFGFFGSAGSGRTMTPVCVRELRIAMLHIAKGFTQTAQNQLSLHVVLFACTVVAWMSGEGLTGMCWRANLARVSSKLPSSSAGAIDNDQDMPNVPSASLAEAWRMHNTFTGNLQD